ncbi:MAG: hypothetical protein JO237_00380 [Pseudolabrys sp.]|nr:hypothetical protein [Pseudolabrys sp.]
MRRWLIRPLWILLAVVFLIEAWLWDHVEPVIAWIVDLIPWRKFRAAVKTRIEHLSPRASLVVFIVPLLLILVPLKFVEFWAISSGNWLIAIAFLAAAKVIGVGVLAFMFDVTRDKLLQMKWFEKFYEAMLLARDWANEQVEPLKVQLRRYLWLLQPSRAVRLLRRLIRQRRRAPGI